MILNLRYNSLQSFSATKKAVLFMDKVQLLDDLAGKFSTSELSELCFTLGVDYEDLGSGGKRSQALAFIAYMERRDRLPELQQAMVNKRPQLAEAYHLSPSPPTQSENMPPPVTTSTPQQPVADPPPPEKQPPPPANPFIAGRMVTHTDMFFGRENERRHLRTRLQTMSSSSIVGMRRIGKSSLMYYLSHHESLFQDGKYIFAFLDMQDARYHTLEGLLSGAVAQWSKKTGQPNDLAIPNLTHFSTWIYRCQADGYFPVLCLDEFENLTKRPAQFNDDVFESWRALGNAGQLAFITVSQQSLSELIKSGGLTSNFDNIFNQLDLTLLDKVPARDLLTTPLTRTGLDVDRAVIDDLLAYCGPHPFYLQMAGFYLCDALANSPFTTAQVKENFTQEVAHHWHGLWYSLTRAEQYAFQQLSLIGKDALLQVSYRALLRKGILLAEDNTYIPFSIGFTQWVQQQPPPPQQITTCQQMYP